MVIDNFSNSFNLVENSCFENLATFSIVTIEGGVTSIPKNFHKVITNTYYDFLVTSAVQILDLKVNLYCCLDSCIL